MKREVPVPPRPTAGIRGEASASSVTEADQSVKLPSRPAAPDKICEKGYDAAGARSVRPDTSHMAQHWYRSVHRLKSNC